MKILEAPLHCISEHEFLEALLYPLVVQKNTNKLAHTLIEKYGSLEEVLKTPAAELESNKGIGKAGAEYLNIVGLTHKFIRQKDSSLNAYIKSPSDIGKLLNPYFEDARHEICYAVSLDINFKVLGVDLVQEGGQSHVRAEIDKVLQIAKRRAASKLILAHNHPSGNLSPSEEDLVFTEQVLIALVPLGIHLVEHCIITNQGILALSRFNNGEKEADFFGNVIMNNRHLVPPAYLREYSIARSKFYGLINKKKN